MDLSLTDSSMDERDIKKEQKELAKLKKFLITERGTPKETDYDKELKELEGALQAKAKKKSEQSAPPVPLSSYLNKKKETSGSQTLGGINFKKLIQTNQRKKLDEDINWNHVERNKRYQLTQQRLEPFKVSPEVTPSRKALAKLRKAQSKLTPAPSTLSAPSVLSAPAFALPKSVPFTVQNPPNKPFPKDRKLHLPPDVKGSLKDYKTSLRVYLK